MNTKFEDIICWTDPKTVSVNYQIAGASLEVGVSFDDDNILYEFLRILDKQDGKFVSTTTEGMEIGVIGNEIHFSAGNNLIASLKLPPKGFLNSELIIKSFKENPQLYYAWSTEKMLI